MNGKCQRCEQGQATVHLTEIAEGGEKREIHLCEACAQQQDGPFELMGMLSTAFTPESTSTAADPAGLRCEECSLGYMEFRSRGRLGCPACYDVFRASLEPLLEKIHGGTQHVGKAPDESSAVDRSRERRLVELRRALQTAVREERYEDAAQLRDDLTRFEAGEELAEAGDHPTGDDAAGDDAAGDDEAGDDEAGAADADL